MEQQKQTIRANFDLDIGLRDRVVEAGKRLHYSNFSDIARRALADFADRHGEHAKEAQAA